MAYPVSSNVANLYMELVESKVLGSFKGTAPSHWYRYMVQTVHINSVETKSPGETKDNSLPFLDRAVHIEENGNLNIKV